MRSLHAILMLVLLAIPAAALGQTTMNPEQILELFQCTGLDERWDAALESGDYSEILTPAANCCEEGEMVGCYYAAVLYERGLDVEPNHELARALYERGCEEDFFESCVRLGVMLADGTGGDRDASRAVELFEIGCAEESPAGCTALGVMLEQGNGVPRDRDRARELYSSACDAGYEPGCEAAEAAGRGGVPLAALAAAGAVLLGLLVAVASARRRRD